MLLVMLSMWIFPIVPLESETENEWFVLPIRGREESRYKQTASTWYTIAVVMHALFAFIDFMDHIDVSKASDF